MSLEREGVSDVEDRKSRKGCGRYAAGLFLALLLISHVIRFLSPDTPELRPDQISMDLRVVDQGEEQDQTVSTAYTLLEPPLQQYPDPTTLILLHGSPMASMSMMPLARTLPDSFRIVVPDLPGFGRSTPDIPDYSIDAHSDYLIQMMDSLGIDQAHFVAYSMSGGVALALYEKTPARVASVVMLSAIGVQELELLGSYEMNHAVHGLQLACIWGLQELFPHMGYLDDALLNTSYARNFYDTDQRPLRGILESFVPPMLIIHGDEDLQVPLDAAIEHHRIVPQSSLALFEGGHGLVFDPSPAFVDTLNQFILSVENQTAISRTDAPESRIATAREPFKKEAFPKAKGLTLLVYMVLIALTTLVTEDGASIGAGLLVAQGTMNYLPAMLAALTGIVVGDVLLFLAGRYLSRPLLSKAPFRWFFSKDAIDRASEWVSRRGAAVIIASRFIPGTRLPTYVAAGSLGLSIWKFLFYFIIASILWTPLLVWFAVIFGEQLLTNFLDIYENYALWIFLGLVLVIMTIVKLIVPMFSHQGRRTLIGKWRRKVHWEFWPMWAFYPPIVLYVLWHGIKHRSITLFTNANPAIYLGGLLGESKSEILGGLAQSADYVAAYVVVEPAANVDQRLAKILGFMSARSIGYPIMLKPDVGERGKEVVKARTEQEIRTYLTDHTQKIIAQAYAPGVEYGVFYYRYPDEDAGHIFSITDKQFPKLVGNGVHNLQRLILDDDRAVCMAEHYFKANRARLFETPEKGEVIQLIDIGTHSRGSIFLDGIEILTPALATKIDQISKTFDGFYFGRFDIRTPSVEDFKEGKNFKIVELNGVSSEATHIYDPKHSLFDAHRILREQWRIAFKIGDALRAQGLQPTSLFQVLKQVFQSK